MIKRYLVVSRDKSAPKKDGWCVDWADIQLRSTAIKRARGFAKFHPNYDVEVWVDITITEKLEKIQ